MLSSKNIYCILKLPKLDGADASGVHGGYAAVFGSNWFTGEWAPAIQPFHITIKELFPK
jgi:hypothetical protein